MEMSIKEALNYMPCLMEACSHCLVRGCDKPIEKIDEAKIVAIDTMRKYKKIQELMVGWYNFNSYEILCAMYKVNLLIGEVAEDEVS